MSTNEKTKKRIEKILLNFDIPETSALFSEELENALGARECGLTFKEIEKMIDQRTEYKRLWVC